MNGPLTIAIRDGRPDGNSALDDVCALDIMFANKALANVAETVAENHPDQMSSFACAQRIVALLMEDRMEMAGGCGMYARVDRPEDLEAAGIPREPQGTDGDGGVS